MKRVLFEKLLDEYIDNYVNQISFELEKSHGRLFEDFGFPLFGEISDHYHEQVFFRSYLESYTRQLINGVLKELLEADAFDYYYWPEFEYNGIYMGYTNQEFEDEFGFEFINRDLKIGYRYTDIQFEEIEDLLKNEYINSITIVRWEENGLSGFLYSEMPIRVLGVRELFHEIICDVDTEEINEMIELFIKKMKDAVKQAYSLISLSSVPGFTPSYIFKTRKETIEKMENDVEELSHFYVNDLDYKYIEKDSSCLINDYHLPQSFVEKGHAHAFAGSSDFARSYLTSEYLYVFFKENPMFDYTPIVSGYLKSIEQLLHGIIRRYHENERIVKDISNNTMGNYIDELTRNYAFKKIFKEEFILEQKCIKECLDCYKVESRNNLFHKDYFDSWTRVKQIRSNTIFLYVVLMEGIKPTFLTEDAGWLGLIDMGYDLLFSTIDHKDNELFRFILDGIEYSDMRKEPRNNGLVFNKNGQIINTITFTRIDYDCLETVEISRSKMPSTIWSTDSKGNQSIKIWPVKK